MGSDLYMESRFHAEENFGPLLTAVEHAIDLLRQGKPDEALRTLEQAAHDRAFRP